MRRGFHQAGFINPLKATVLETPLTQSMKFQE